MASISTDGRLQAPELAELKSTATLSALVKIWMGAQIVLAAFLGGVYGGLITDPLADFPFSGGGMIGGAIVGAFAIIPVYAIYRVGEKILHTLHAQFEAGILVDNWRSRNAQHADSPRDA